MDKFLIFTGQKGTNEESSDDEDFGLDVSSMSIISSESSDSEFETFHKKDTMKLFMSGMESIRSQSMTALAESKKGQTEFFNKDESQLKLASEVLFDNLVVKRKKEDLNLKRELENMDTFECKYGDKSIIFFNAEKNYVKSTHGFLKVKPRLFLSILFRFLISNIEVGISLCLILNQVINGAFDNIFILGILFFLIIPETHRGSTKWWKVLFLCYLLKCSLKYVSKLFLLNWGSGVEGMIQSSAFESSFSFSLKYPINMIILIFGNVSYSSDVLMVVLIFFLTLVLESRGFSETKLFKYEDPGSCTARICLNENKNVIFNNYAKFLLYKNDIQNDWLHSYLKKYEKDRGKAILRNYSLDLIKQKIHLSLIYDIFRKEFNRHLMTYLKRTRNDLQKATTQNMDNFYWRNFS